MLNFLAHSGERHFIDTGSVFCPLRSADVELDVCAGCRWMLEIDQDAKLPFVICRPPPKTFVPL